MILRQHPPRPYSLGGRQAKWGQDLRSTSGPNSDGGQVQPVEVK